MIEGLDSVIHAPKRLAVMAVLVNSSATTFRFLKEHLDVSDSDLSKHMSALEGAGYVKVHKEGRGRGASTTFTATRAGERAYGEHREALRTLLGM